jgi:acyl-CoA reductase-like NAD-dependent aldehyde dehydrogenase
LEFNGELENAIYRGVLATAIWINDPLTDHDVGPFGGMKKNGTTWEIGTEGLANFLETKPAHWDF